MVFLGQAPSYFQLEADLKDPIPTRKSCKKVGTKQFAIIKKFAERVKMAFYQEFDEVIPSIMAIRIDEIARELENEK